VAEYLQGARPRRLFLKEQVAAIALQTICVVHPMLMSSRQAIPIWLAVVAAILRSPIVAGAWWLSQRKDLRAALALTVNLGGLAAIGLGFVLAVGHAEG
jgi:hypothetical protein